MLGGSRCRVLGFVAPDSCLSADSVRLTGLAYRSLELRLQLCLIGAEKSAADFVVQKHWRHLQLQRHGCALPLPAGLRRFLRQSTATTEHTRSQATGIEHPIMKTFPSFLSFRPSGLAVPVPGRPGPTVPVSSRAAHCRNRCLQRPSPFAAISISHATNLQGFVPGPDIWFFLLRWLVLCTSPSRTTQNKDDDNGC